jgi:hypothetical protein
MVSMARNLVIRNISNTALGVCGKVIPIQGFTVIPMSRVYEWRSGEDMSNTNPLTGYRSSLVELMRAGKISCTLDDGTPLSLTDLDTTDAGGLLQTVLEIQQTTPKMEKGTRSDLWIDGVNGDDSYDGLSQNTAVQTVLRLKELIPDIIETNFFVINVRGPLTLTPANNTILWFNTQVSQAGVKPVVIITGEQARAVHLDNGSGGNIVSDFNAVGQVGLTTATWTENEHRAYWCEFKTGTLAGQTFIVDHNDATKLYLMNCDTDPGAGAEFVLYQPKTEVTSGPFWLGEDQMLSGVLNGPGELNFNNIHFTGGSTFSMENVQNLSTSQVYCGDCIIKGDAAFFNFVCDGGGMISLQAAYYDVTVPTPVFTQPSVGVSVSVESPVGAVYIYCNGVCILDHALLPLLNVWYCNGAFQTFVSSIHATNLLCSKVPGHGGYAFGSWASWVSKPTRFGGHRAFGVPTPDRPAIEMYDSEADFQKSLIVDSTMALRMIASKAVIQEADGTDHTLCGVHADALSAVFLVPGTVPTLAGNAGAVELSIDGTTEKSKWAAIAVTPVSDPECVCKEYAPTFAFSFPV